MKTKKIPIALMFIFLINSFFSTAQMVQLVPPIDFQNLHYGDSIKIEIKNTGGQTKSMYFRTVFDTGESHIFLSDQDFIYRTHTFGSRLSQMSGLASILKSNRFRNNYIPPNDSGDMGIIPKRFSIPIFMLGFGHESCGQYSEVACKVLQATGAFKPDSFFRVASTKHQLTTAIIDEEESVPDFDPGTPFFMPKFPNGHYMSLKDISDSSQYLLGQEWVYCDPVSGACEQLVSVGGDSQNMSPLQENLIRDSMYVGMVQAPMLWSPAPIIDRQDSGLFRIPVGATLKYFLAKVPRIVTLTTTQRDSLATYVVLGDDVGLLNCLSRFLGISYQELVDELTADEILSLDSGYTANDVVLSSIYQKEVQLYLHISPQPFDILIGRDLMAPCWVRSVTTDHSLVVGEATYPIGTTKNCLWNQKGYGDTSCNLHNDQAAYFPVSTEMNAPQSGFIPAWTTVDMVLLYNQFMYPFINGLVANFLGTDTTGLVVTTHNTPSISTGLQKILPSTSIRVYPNPCSEKVSVESPCAQSFTIFSIVGDRVSTGSLVVGKNDLNVRSLVSGVYILKTENSTVKFVKHE